MTTWNCDFCGEKIPAADEGPALIVIDGVEYDACNDCCCALQDYGTNKSLPAPAEFVKATKAVAALDWRTSVSESEHFSRIAAMDRLRAALEAAFPAQPEKETK